jgi:UTP--glucose-1-phosphate uridylyltransferase
MASLTGGTAKELVSVAGVPLLERVMAECAASGITDLLVVAAPDKADVVEVAKAAAGRSGMPRRVEIVIQPEARGLADAIRLGKDFSADESFGVALPDNLFLADVPALRQVIETQQRTGKNVVATVEIFPESAGRAGPTAIYPGKLVGDEFQISGIPSKGARSSTFDLGGMRSAFTGVGRYVFLPEVFAVIDEVEKQLAPGAELDDVPVLSLLLARGRLTGRRIVGHFLDVGFPVGYHDANERLASADQQPRLAR